MHIPFFTKAVHNIKQPLTFSEYTVHMQNQLKAGSFVRTKAGLSHDMQFFSYACAMKWTVLRWPYWLNAQANWARFLLYLNKPSIALVIELGRCNVTFWLTSWTWFISALLKMFKECSKHRGTCSIQDVGTIWRSWRRCSWILFIANTFC